MVENEKCKVIGLLILSAFGMKRWGLEIRIRTES
jgi:hypothetical protein